MNWTLFGYSYILSSVPLVLKVGVTRDETGTSHVTVNGNNESGVLIHTDITGSLENEADTHTQSKGHVAQES